MNGMCRVKDLRAIFLLTLFLLNNPIFAKLSTPVIFKPTNNTVNAPTGMQLEVKTENSSTHYAFEYSTDASMKNAARVEVVRDAYYTRTWVNKLKFNTTYYWRAKAINKTDSSDWTSINNFKTTAVLKRYYPLQNAKNNASFLYLSAYRAAGFDSFELQIDTSKLMWSGKNQADFERLHTALGKVLLNILML